MVRVLLLIGLVVNKMPILPEFMPEGKPGETAEAFSQGRTEGESWMAMQQQRQLRDQQIQQARAALVMQQLAMPLHAAQIEADKVKAQTAYDGALQTQELRKQAYALKAKADMDFDQLNLITDDKARAVASREWLSRYSQLANIEELKGEFSTKSHLATSNVVDSMKLNMLTGADYRSFQAMTAGMSPEDQQKARDIKLGLEGRASSAGKKSQTVKLPDGSEAEMVFDPNTGKYSIPSINQTTTPSNSEALKQNPFVSQSTEEKARETEKGKSTAEYEAQLRKEKTKRQASLRQAELLTDRMGDDIDELISKVNASTAGPGGTLMEKFPGTSARDLSSNLDSIKANIGFQTLQAMREASPTGGALGQVSDVEGRQLQAALGSLQIGQSPAQLIANLKKVKQRVTQNFGIVRSAYENQYGETHAATDHPAGWDDDKEQRLNELKAKLGK